MFWFPFIDLLSLITLRPALLRRHLGSVTVWYNLHAWPFFPTFAYFFYRIFSYIHSVYKISILYIILPFLMVSIIDRISKISMLYVFVPFSKAVLVFSLRPHVPFLRRSEFHCILVDCLKSEWGPFVRWQRNGLNITRPIYFSNRGWFGDIMFVFHLSKVAWKNVSPQNGKKCLDLLVAPLI